MLPTGLATLVAITSGPLTEATPLLPAFEPERLRQQLEEMLTERNGFYALESALHVLPATADADVVSLAAWNALPLWKESYGENTSGLTCFAQDAFGNPFALGEDGVSLLELESGSREVVAGDLEGWAKAVLEDSYWTGYSLAHDWQERNGPLEPGFRLCPVKPFVLGGEFTVENLRAIPSLEALAWRADLARQTRELPDGAKVELRIG